MNVEISAPLPVGRQSDQRIYAGLSWLALVALGALPLLLAVFLPDAAGWVLLYLTYALFMAFPEFRRNGRVVLAGFVVLTLHHLVSFVNAYVRTVVGADADAVTFHNDASDLAHGINTGPDTFLAGNFVYTHLLGFFYRLFGASLFLGEELSVLAFALSCIVLVKLCDQIGLSRFRAGLLLLFGLSLSGLIFLSVTLRESWQVLFVLLSTYWALRVRRRVSVLNVFFLLLSAVGLGLLHQGLGVYAVFLVLISLYFGVGTGDALSVLWKRGVVLCAAVVLLAAVASEVKHLGGASAALASGNALEYAQNYRMHSSQEARAAYGIALNASTPLSFAATLPLVLIEYMFAPFPWQVRSPLDIEAMLEGGARLILLYMAWRMWRHSTGEGHSRLGFLLTLFLTMEFLWALGTVNWGTAVRHHILAYGLLVLTGGPGLMAFLGRSFHALLSPGGSSGTASQT